MDIQFVTPLDKKEFMAIYDDSITKKHYDQLLNKIDERLHYCLLTSLKILGHPYQESSWFDYENGGEEDRQGYFDPQTYQDQIDLCGRYESHPDLYNTYIPTAWLYTDFEEALKKELEAYKEKKINRLAKAKKTADERKQKVATLETKILAVLSPEEQAFIQKHHARFQFKKPKP